jgi:pyrroloquinoline quinone (PQQ) biosynthesis protein C
MVYRESMDTYTSTTIRQSLQGRLLLTHPFYRRWEAGGLSTFELARYAEQYRYFEAYLPEFLSRLSECLDEGTAKDAVEANLKDEVAEPTHLQLFDQFAAEYGAEPSECSPAMSALLAAYRMALCEGGPTALAALAAYEVQSGEIAQTKHDGLKTHYGATSSALEFWFLHGTVEQDHATWTLDGLASLSPSVHEVLRGVTPIANAWWEFLNERESLALV